MKACAALAVGMAVTLAGCSANDVAVPASSSSAKPPASTVPVSQRGNAIKKPGETAYWDLKDGGSLSFVIDNFRVTSQCIGGEPPTHGANLVFDLRVSTPANWPVDAGNVFHRVGYAVIGPDGTTVRDTWQGNTSSCSDYDAQWADPLAPGSTYRGTVVLDVPPDSTVLTFNPKQITVRAFEWVIPAR